MEEITRETGWEEVSSAKHEITQKDQGLDLPLQHFSSVTLGESLPCALGSLHLVLTLCRTSGISLWADMVGGARLRHTREPSSPAKEGNCFQLSSSWQNNLEDFNKNSPGNPE